MTDGTTGGYLDIDSDDSFLDLSLPLYEGGSVTGEEIDYLLEAARRGDIELPELPPPVER